MITLTPIGEIEETVLESLERRLAEVLGQETQIDAKMVIPQEGYDHSRNQYLASLFLSLIPLPDLGERTLGVVDVDIFAPGLNFVFGMADTAGGRALIFL